MMDAQFLIALAVAVAVIGSAGLEHASGIPAPVFLIPAGVGVSYVPGLPEVVLGPKVVFFVFLPPLLYSAAFVTSPREWRANWRPITTLAVGLVVATMFAVAAVTEVLIGDLDWAAAFVLGAVLAPTDPVAATGVIGRLRAPARLRTILEGESLVNDGVALAIYSIAVAAAVSGSFSVLHGFVRFLEVAAGGIAIGIALGWLVAHLRRRIHDPLLEITISLLTPYLAYLPAEEAHVSGILATVTTGAYLGSQSEGIFRAQTRLQASAFWGVLTFLTESALFVLLGAQLPLVISGLSGHGTTSLVADAVLAFGVVVAVRLAWQFTVPHLVHALDVRFRELRSPMPGRERFLLGWAGMRGAVTLAAALSIPRDLPARQLVLFLAFSVILATILVQGLTLPLLVRALGLAEPEEARRHELDARVRLAEAALNRLDEIAAEETFEAEAVEPLRRLHAGRVERHTAELEEEEDGQPSEPSIERLQVELIRAQRDMLRRLGEQGDVDPATARRLERELDLEESRAAPG
jgi:Na+/H+ antiporter